MTNQGTAPFVISSFSARVTPPGVSAGRSSRGPAIDFVLAFGSSTIAPQASLQGPCCASVGNWEDVTLQWTFIDVSGAAFTTPVIAFLRP